MGAPEKVLFMESSYFRILMLFFTGLLWCFGCQKTVTPESEEVTVRMEPEQVLSGPFFGDLEEAANDGINDAYDWETAESAEVINPLSNEEGEGKSEIVAGGGNGFGAQFIAEGVKLTPLTDDGKSSAAAWAYHGDKIAFVRRMAGGTQIQMFIMNADGTEEEAVTPIGYPFFAEWSWKGDKLAYMFSNSWEGESQGSIHIYDVSTKKTRSVSAPYPKRSFDPTDGPYWSADDRYVAYKIRPGAGRKSQLWVADTISGRYNQILTDRGHVGLQRWSSSLPNRISLMTQASGDRFDAVTIGPAGRKLTLLTDIGAESISVTGPLWSPTEDWIAFLSDIDMTQSERKARRKDCWIVRPDGSEARNLTNATSPATEDQLSMSSVKWSWDGRWLLAPGTRYENQGYPIPTYYLVDPVNGGYEPIITFHPRETGEIDQFQSSKWSYDSTKIVFLGKRRTVRNWGPRPRYERSRSVLKLLDVRTRKVEDLLVFDEELDRKEIQGSSARAFISDISWSPDNRSILLTIATIVSRSDRIFQPDVYRLDLPDRFVDPNAPLYNGPPMGRSETVTQPIVEPTETQEETITIEP
ncbi:TolB family protein, partial [Planctomycetota bacterium]